jgi:hypothetical protein
MAGGEKGGAGRRRRSEGVNEVPRKRSGIIHVQVEINKVLQLYEEYQDKDSASRAKSNLRR